MSWNPINDWIRGASDPAKKDNRRWAVAGGAAVVGIAGGLLVHPVFFAALIVTVIKIKNAWKDKS